VLASSPPRRNSADSSSADVSRVREYRTRTMTDDGLVRDATDGGVHARTRRRLSTARRRPSTPGRRSRVTGTHARGSSEGVIGESRPVTGVTRHARGRVFVLRASVVRRWDTRLCLDTRLVYYWYRVYREGVLYPM
jgi:hypothetical protein